jgi:signal transduction histidine kinase/DNA-binding LacI/PurR family transcriptional regulator/DNA-binding response OmpR family regulator
MGKYKRTRPTIGVLPGWQAYTGTLDSFLGEVLHGIQAAAREHACNLLLACGMSSTQIGIPGIPAWPIEDPAIEFLPVGHWNTDGLIMIPPITFDSVYAYIQSLKRSNFPFVFAGDRESGPSIVVDNAGGIRQAVMHLYEHGHREIAFISGNGSAAIEGDSRLRLNGFMAVMHELGLPLNPDLIASGNHNQVDGCRAMAHILQNGAHFTAVLASNDQSALGVIDALAQTGLLVPQDVAVIGFDDRLEGRALEPSLTTVHFPMFELGYRSLELLLKFIEEGCEPDTLIQIPTRLVVRKSCGCVPSAMGKNPPANWPDEITSPAPAFNRRSRMKGTLAENVNHRGSTLQITQVMTGMVFNDLQRLNLKEVSALCQRLVEAFKASLTYGDPTIFRLTTQQVLERVASAGDDLFAWQSAISVLGENADPLMKVPPAEISRQQVEDMLHQARVMVSEVSRGQYSRILLNKATMTDHFGRMTARFFSMQNEAALFDLLAKEIPAIGIRTATVCFFEPEGVDPVAWSVAQTPDYLGQSQRRFPTRSFPPTELLPEEKPFDLAILPLSGLGDIFGYVAYETDDLEFCALVTRQLAAALWSIRLYCQALENRRLAEERRQAAEEANRLKSRFLSMVSHELRTPLNLISGLSDMLLRDSQKTTGQVVAVGRLDLERIYISAQHLDGLIRDVLDLAVSDVGQLKLVNEPLDLNEVLSIVSVIGEQLAVDKDLRWRTDIACELPLVWGDRTRLRQIILNLVNNAVKFTAHGKVELIARVEENQIVISVSDTGLGIPLNEQELIFNEFHQSERTATRGYGGLGLGLAICKRLVEMHGGQISASSSGGEGQGSTFSVVLPIYKPHPQVNLNLLPLSDVKRVFLLHKNLAYSAYLRDHLTGCGYEVISCQADNSSDWLAILLNAAPDVVILDLGATAEHGWEILKILRENPATQRLPVFFYTVAEDGQSGSFLEMNYLTKPLNPDILSETLIAQGLAGSPSSNGKRKAILVVDDEPEMLELHARLLETQSPSYEVLRALNGRQALAIMHQERPALVLLDIMMPEMDGFAVLERMRDENLIPGIPVIVVTSQALTEEDMARLNQEVSSVLEKGIYSAQETLAHVKDALAHRRRAGSETQRIVLKAMAFIHAHYAETISRSDVAKHIGLSERHLTRCFNQEVGMSLITYLNRYRVRVAKAMLDSGKKGITEIAVDVGFSTNAYFTHVFHDEVGVSPRAYLQSKRPEKSG